MSLISSLFGQNQNNGYSQAQIQGEVNTRQGQINDFANTLANARNTYYKTTLPNFQNYAMSQFMPNIQAQYAGQGLTPSGGAFASALARQAANFQAQQSLGQYQDIQNQANQVQGYDQNLGNAFLGVMGQNFQGATPPNAGLAALGGAVGQVSSGLIGNALSNQNYQNLAQAMSQMYSPNSGAMNPGGSTTPYYLTPNGMPSQPNTGQPRNILNLQNS